MHKRLFVGIPIQEHIVKSFRDFQRHHRHHQNIRWVAERNLHVTALFIGKTAVGEVDKVCRSIEQVATVYPHFQLTFDRYEVAPPGKKPRMFWARFQKNEAFSNLSQSLSFALLKNPDQINDPIPHATLARFRYLEKDKKLNLRLHLDRKILEVNQLILWESELHEAGAMYHALRSFSLL